MALPPLLDPQIERVVQVDVGQQRADAAALNRPTSLCVRPALFQHTGVQPLADQTHDARIGHPVLDELDQPVVLDRVVVGRALEADSLCGASRLFAAFAAVPSPEPA